MLGSLIELCIKHRFAVVFLGLFLVAAGVYSLQELPLDAFPDTTPVIVQVNTVAPALDPEEMESQVTTPLELAIGGLPALQAVRSISKFGLSQVTATFEDGTDIYRARQLVQEKILSVELPEGISRPKLGPVATGLGEIFHYLVKRPVSPGMAEEDNLRELRIIQDWVIKPQLRSVPGVAEVNSWGGLEKEYHVEVDTARLAKYGLAIQDVLESLRKNNLNVGGGRIESSGEVEIVKGIGVVTKLDDIAGIVLTTADGVPVRVRDVADVIIGHGIRRAATTAEGQGEVVLGLGFMLMGENSRAVTARLEKRLEEVRRTLPRGVSVEIVYERNHLVSQVLDTVGKNLSEGALLVVAVLFAFLGNLRAGLVVASAIPLSMIFAGNMMLRFGIAGSLLSLGAIDFGLIVDSSVVMVENCARHLAADRSGRLETEILRDAALEVRKPTLFGELIIMVVYLPILTLEGVEGKLFRPMALTVLFALSASLILSLTLVPALAAICLPRRMKERRTLIDRWTHAIFQPILRLGLRFPWTTVAIAVAMTAVTTVVGLHLGTEFIPRLNEGTIVINAVRLSGISLDEATRYNTRIEKLLRAEFPDEIERVWSRTGTPEIATDPMGLEVSDIFITLVPRGKWRRASTQEELVTRIATLVQQLPGMRAVMTQPIEMRMNELVMGVRGDVGIKIFGDDLDALKQKAGEVETILKAIPGAADVYTEQITGQPMLVARVNEDAAARLGVSRAEVLAMIEAVGGIPAGEVREERRRFPLVLHLASAYRDDRETLGRAIVTTASGRRVPLENLVTLERGSGPTTISHEWGRRRILVQANVRGRDMGSFVEEAQEKVNRWVQYPFTVDWGGQFEHLERARRKLLFVLPAALLLILGLLYASFGSLRDSLIVFSGVFFARMGGVLGLWIRGMHFSISAGIGFVALAGAAMLEGLVLVSYIRRLMARGLSRREAIEEARLVRLRPVLMTGLVAALGFVPMAFSTGVGAEIQRPLATVVVFGIATDTVLTLLVLPVLYLLFGKGAARADD